MSIIKSFINLFKRKKLNEREKIILKIDRLINQLPDLNTWMKFNKEDRSLIKDLIEDQFKRLYKYDDTKFEVKGKAYLKDERPIN